MGSAGESRDIETTEQVEEDDNVDDFCGRLAAGLAEVLFVVVGRRCGMFGRDKLFGSVVAVVVMVSRIAIAYC